ncbi:MAG TPA: hypothetical protein DEA08_16205 [Planctomycetes bacterium]|nr:hypothetical protein [Planctomycetota bacterium]
MSSRPREALEFFRAIAAGDVVLNAKDPSHAHALKAACGSLEHYASLAESVPELAEAVAGLAPGEGSAEEQLERQLSVLRRVLQAIAERRDAVEAKLDELRRAELAKNAPSFSLGSPDDPWFEGVVAIDLGSSNVVCARWNFQAEEPEISSYEPLAVNVLDAPGFAELKEGSFLTGEDALRHKSQINLYRSFRRLLGTRTSSRPAVTGGNITQVGIADLAAAMLQDLLRKLTRAVSTGPIHFPQVSVTVPATGDQAFEYELRQVCERLGLTARTDLDEATAAGVYYLLRPLLLREYSRETRSDGQAATPADYYARHYGLKDDEPLHVLCVDLGGGTTDLALLRLEIQQDHRSCRVHIAVTGTSGFTELSGEGLTLFLFELLKRRFALAMAHPRRALSGGLPDPEPPHLHAWIGYHRLEVGIQDVTLNQRLDKGYRLLLANWEEVAGTNPLSPELREAVDQFCPTISEGAPRKGRKFRKALFRWLWEEAERLKREVCRERAEREQALADGGVVSGVARARLDLSGAPAQPVDLDIVEWLTKKGRCDPKTPNNEDGLALRADDIDAYVRRRGGEALIRTVRGLAGEVELGRVLLAGNGAHAARPVIEELLAEHFGVGADKVRFDGEEAKKAVAKGACLWAIGNRLEGIEVSLTRALRHPCGLVLVSALKQEQLYVQGEPVDRFTYAQPETREGDAHKLIQVDREKGGKLEPFLMFDPRKGEPLRPLSALPISKAPDVTIPDIDAFTNAVRDQSRCQFQVIEPHQYVQTDSAEWVSQGEMFENLRARMTMEESIAWMESSQHLQQDPPPGKAVHRYYMDETRQLFLVFHTAGSKILVHGTVVDSAKREVPADQDPFNGAH